MLYKFKFYLLNATFRLEALEKSVSDSDVGSHQKDFVHFGLPPTHPPVGGGGWWLLGGMVVGGGDGGWWVWGVGYEGTAYKCWEFSTYFCRVTRHRITRHIFGSVIDALTRLITQMPSSEVYNLCYKVRYIFLFFLLCFSHYTVHYYNT